MIISSATRKISKYFSDLRPEGEEEEKYFWYFSCCRGDYHIKLHEDISKLYHSSEAKLRNCDKVLKYQSEVLLKPQWGYAELSLRNVAPKFPLGRGIYIVCTPCTSSQLQKLSRKLGSLVPLLLAPLNNKMPTTTTVNSCPSSIQLCPTHLSLWNIYIRPLDGPWEMLVLSSGDLVVRDRQRLHLLETGSAVGDTSQTRNVGTEICWYFLMIFSVAQRRFADIFWYPIFHETIHYTYRSTISGLGFHTIL